MYIWKELVYFFFLASRLLIYTRHLFFLLFLILPVNLSYCYNFVSCNLVRYDLFPHNFQIIRLSVWCWESLIKLFFVRISIIYLPWVLLQFINDSKKVNLPKYAPSPNPIPSEAVIKWQMKVSIGHGKEYQSVIDIINFFVQMCHT